MRYNDYRVLAFVVAALLAAAPLAAAHHSFLAQFDMDRPVSVKGTVTKVDWSNPHISFFVDVRNENGQVTIWSFDAASPTVLAARGWGKTAMKPGDVVVADGYLAKNGKPLAAANTVILADGRRVYAGSDGVYTR